jgi:hypothetical protein
MRKFIYMLLIVLGSVSCSTPSIIYQSQGMKKGNRIYVEQTGSASDILFARLKGNRDLVVLSKKEVQDYIIVVSQNGASISYRVSDSSGLVVYMMTTIIARNFDSNVEEFTKEFMKLVK